MTEKKTDFLTSLQLQKFVFYVITRLILKHDTASLESYADNLLWRLKIDSGRKVGLLDGRNDRWQYATFWFNLLCTVYGKKEPFYFIHSFLKR